MPTFTIVKLFKNKHYKESTIKYTTKINVSKVKFCYSQLQQSVAGSSGTKKQFKCCGYTCLVRARSRLPQHCTGNTTTWMCVWCLYIHTHIHIQYDVESVLKINCFFTCFNGLLVQRMYLSLYVYKNVCSGTILLKRRSKRFFRVWVPFNLLKRYWYLGIF